MIWAKAIGGSSGDIGNSIAVDSSGNTYTTGFFNNTADFDPGAGTANLTAAGGQDIFVVKLGDLPTVSLTATDTAAAEGNSNTGTFRLTRSSSSGTLAVQLSPASGIGTDYNLSVVSGGTLNAGGTVFTFDDGVSTADITFTAIDDIPAEDNETFALSLATDPAYIVDATNNTGSVTIQQNDFAVTNTNDSGEGSLRQAMLNANAITGTNKITFNISGTGPHTISPTSALPTITEAVVIDGYSQAGASKNTLTASNNAQLKIVLDGTNAGAGVNGLTLDTSTNGSTIQGLTINRFQGDGILIQSSDNFIVGNFIGTDNTGTIDRGNSLTGITIGAGTNNTIGGSNAGDRNIISGNDQEGILIRSSTGNNIQSNSIFDNNRLGIDLSTTEPGDGITANDAGDGDTGANNLQNFPVLTFAKIVGSNTACAGTFNSTANTTFRLEFFANDVLDASGNGEGKTYLGFTTLTTDASGNANFNVTNLSLASLSNYVTATATNLTTNDTSEFSNGVIIDVPTVKITPPAITTNEGNSGTTDYTFAANLSRATTQTVTVNYTTNDSTATLADNDYIDNDNSITFTPGGALTQTITVQAKGDAIAENDETFTLNLESATNAKIDPTAKQGTATITNDGKAGIIVTQNPAVTTTESGGTATFTIKLVNQPTSDVTINLSSDNTKEGQPDKSSLTFTSANWNVDQTVTIIGQDDFIVDGNFAYNIITAKSTSADTNYNNLDVVDVPVINSDNDIAGFTITPTPLTTAENGTNATLNVKLNTQPTADVILGLSSTNTAEGTIDKSSLTFTAGNWNIIQTVTVTGIDDNIIDGDKGYQITTAAATSTDNNYNNLNPSDINVTNIDNDSASVRDDLLFGGNGNDVLNGNAGNDTLFGEEGNDTVRGGKNDDIVAGNAGNDMLLGEKGNDSLCGEEGNDTIYGGNGNSVPIGNHDERDCICGGKGNDLLFGNEGDDRIWGDEGDDTLVGGKNNDILRGGAGSDRLIGDWGYDMLAGGSGHDIFVLSPSKGTNTILDFEDNLDLLELDGNFSFSQLSIIQGNQAALIVVTQTNELLAIINGMQPSAINVQDFVFTSS